MVRPDERCRGAAAQLTDGTRRRCACPGYCARRTGKTSVADAVLAACRQDGCHVARVDLFREADAPALAQALTLELLANRPGIRRALAATGRARDRMVQALSTTATLRARGELGEELEVALDIRAAREDPQAALAAALDLP